MAVAAQSWSEWLSASSAPPSATPCRRCRPQLRQLQAWRPSVPPLRAGTLRQVRQRQPHGRGRAPAPRLPPRPQALLRCDATVHWAAEGALRIGTRECSGPHARISALLLLAARTPSSETGRRGTATSARSAFRPKVRLRRRSLRPLPRRVGVRSAGHRARRWLDRACPCAAPTTGLSQTKHMHHSSPLQHSGMRPNSR